MTTNEALIHKLYSGFQNRDYRSMQSCYADTATFNDPVFVDLNATDVKAMWEMFCVKGKDMRIEYKNVAAGERTGSADWIAHYTFSATGRKVVNRVHASFEFQNGLVVKHTDRFNFYRWSSQALGPTGKLLGWTPFVKHKVQRTALENLRAFERSKTT